MKKGMLPGVPDGHGQHASLPPARVQTVIWVQEGPLCVEIVDPPPPRLSAGHCRCGACQVHEADLAVHYF